MAIVVRKAPTGSPPPPPTDGVLYAGLESFFTYNGVTLNDLSSDSKYRITQIGGLHTADIRDMRENRPSNDGEIPLTARYGGRTLTLQGRIESYTGGLHGLRLMENQLVQALAPLQESTLYIDNTIASPVGWNVQIDCRPSQGLAMTEEQKSYYYFRDFMITLRASNPLIVSQDLQTYAWTATGSTQAGVLTSLTNLGNYKSHPVISLVGPMTDPLIMVGSQSLFFTSPVTIPSGKTWMIDTHAGTIIDSDDANQINSVDFSSVFPILNPGSNTIYFSATGLSVGVSQVEIEYRHSWL